MELIANAIALSLSLSLFKPLEILVVNDIASIIRDLICRMEPNRAEIFFFLSIVIMWCGVVNPFYHFNNRQKKKGKRGGPPVNNELTVTMTVSHGGTPGEV